MPGVPRSKGCENCRRRKKGCDLKRPCGRCNHLRLQCDFGRGFKFVDETQPRKHKLKPSRYVYDFHPTTIDKPAEFSSGTLDIAALHDLAKSAHQANAIGKFWDAYASSACSSRSATMTAQKWLQDILQGSDHPALRSALLSLATARLGRVSGREDARRQAATQYSTSIAEIRKAISHPQRKFDEGLLAAVMVLGTYEIHEGSQHRASAWVAHIDGASKLIAIRGARNISSDFAKSLYFGHAMNELINAIGSRNRTRQSYPVPSLSDFLPDYPCPSHELELFHILNRIPAIIQHADDIKLLADPSTILSATSTLHTRSHSVMVDLETWKFSLTALNGTPYWHSPSTLYASLPSSSPERIFPTMLTYTSLVTAYHYTTLSTCLLLLHSTLFLTHRHITLHHPSVPLDTLPPIPQHTHSICHDLALFITQSLEYFVQPDMGLVGAQQIGFPSSVAMGYFQFFKSKEILWFRVIFRRLRELHLGIEGFLRSMVEEQGLQLMIP